MQFSGVLVVSPPANVADVTARLNAIPGVEVYASHVESGRIVVILEAADIEGHESRLRAIQRVPGVLAAELVYHVADPGSGDGAPGVPEPLDGAAALQPAAAAGRPLDPTQGMHR
jgi:nitrate reductase NapD